MVIVASAATWFALARQQWQPTLGITYSDSYAEYLDLPVDAYDRILDDLAPQHIRLPVEWDRIEMQAGERDFSLPKARLDTALARNIPVTLAVGLKVPRYPECHIPSWTTALDEAAFEQALFAYLDDAVRTLGTHPAVTAIQIENEPWFPFGECPPPDADRFAREVALARSIVPQKPMQTTVSGEQDLWLLRTSDVDRIGASVYRMAWSPTIGPAVFFYPPRFYVYQIMMARLMGVDVTFSEVQTEPWIAKPWQIDDSRRYTATDLRTTMLFARLIGVRKMDLWGVEWWYHGKQQGWGDAVWQEAIQTFRAP